MTSNMKDVLMVDYKSNKIKFDLTYGYLDKIYDAFNFKTRKNENIEEFVLQLDNETMPDGQYLLLDDITTSSNNFHSIELNLDGLEYKGYAKISKFFDQNGININLHLLEEQP